MEGENPTQRYKWFRPRQAARGFLLQAAGTLQATVSLYNDSSGAHYIAIRAIECSNTSQLGIPLCGVRKGALGTVPGNENAIIPGEATLPGEMWGADLAIATDADWMSPAYTQHSYPLAGPPIAILPPNWSFYVQNPTAADAFNVAFLWEAIFADELDFMW